MPAISIEVNEKAHEAYLMGDVKALKLNRFAWRYISDFLKASFQSDRIVIPFAEKRPNEVLTSLSDMLHKYGFEETRTKSAEQILQRFYEEQDKFTEFSQKALRIRNNECDVDEFRSFIQAVEKYLRNRSLYPLQLLSAYHLAFSQNACNFSVPGAGKTSIVYGAYAYLHNLPDDDKKYIEKLLIIGPLSSFGPWESEYRECFGRLPETKRLIGGMTKSAKQDYLYSSSSKELTLISYESAVSLIDDLGYFLRHNKVMVVLDEAHKIKNSSGGIRAKSILGLADLACSRVILTGTPAPNGYEDLYNMFKFIWPSKNVIGFELNQLRDMTAHENKNRVDRLIQNIAPYFIRIKKKDLNIPPATINPPVLVQMGPQQRKIYNFIEKKYIDAILADGEVDLSTKFKEALAKARIIRLMQAASDPEMLRRPLSEFLKDEECPNDVVCQAVDDRDILDAIMNYTSAEVPSKYIATKKLVDKILVRHEKVVIWATFIHTINRLKSYLERNGIACQVLYGATPVEAESQESVDGAIKTRESIVREFQSENCPYKVVIANPFAVAESISLHKACHNAIYVERSFNAAHFVQSKDRIHRYGLKPGTKTNYYFIVAEDSIEETIDERLREKERRMTEIMENMPIPLFDNVSVEFGSEDIKALIRDYARRTKRA